MRLLNITVEKLEAKVDAEFETVPVRKPVRKVEGFSSCLICKNIVPISEKYNSRVCSELCWDFYLQRGE